MHTHILLGTSAAVLGGILVNFVLPTTITAYNPEILTLTDTTDVLEVPNEHTDGPPITETTPQTTGVAPQTETAATPEVQEPILTKPNTPAPVSVPFFSQFADISQPSWRKVSCGVASLAMLVNYYRPDSTDADTLLKEGLAAGAFDANVGWSHAGLIALSREYALTGESVSLAILSRERAIAALRTVVAEGPVMTSVHYTFEPTNPIPHLVVVTSIIDDTVYYNDPAEAHGGGSIALDTFARAWKQRYIAIRPV